MDGRANFLVPLIVFSLILFQGFPHPYLSPDSKETEVISKVPIAVVGILVSNNPPYGTITGINVFDQNVSSFEEGGFSNYADEGDDFEISISSEEKGVIASGSLSLYDNYQGNFNTSFVFFLPEDYSGEELFARISRKTKIVDSKQVVYCGDKTCSKGERATTCPSDCILGGLSPQQGSKKVPYIAAGLFLLIVSGAIFYIVTKKGQ